MNEFDSKISDLLIEQLITAIEQIIFTAGFQSISEYDLLKRLQSPPYELLCHLSLKENHELFQLHFLIFHALYRLRARLLTSNNGFLKISPLTIELENKAPQKNDLPNTTLAQSKITAIDHLAEYYLNLNHLTETTPQDIDQLILGFWKDFHHPDAHRESLEILELSPPVTFREIKMQYKRLASRHHPDKGGSKAELQKINQAMATLTRTYRQHN